MQLNVNVETTVVSKIDERFDDFDEQRDSCVTECEKDAQDVRDSAEKGHRADFPWMIRMWAQYTQGNDLTFYSNVS